MGKFGLIRLDPCLALSHELIEGGDGNTESLGCRETALLVGESAKLREFSYYAFIRAAVADVRFLFAGSLLGLMPSRSLAENRRLTRAMTADLARAIHGDAPDACASRNRASA